MVKFVSGTSQLLPSFPTAFFNSFTEQPMSDEKTIPENYDDGQDMQVGHYHTEPRKKELEKLAAEKNN